MAIGNHRTSRFAGRRTHYTPSYYQRYRTPYTSLIGNTTSGTTNTTSSAAGTSSIPSSAHTGTSSIGSSSRDENRKPMSTYRSRYAHTTDLPSRYGEASSSNDQIEPAPPSPTKRYVPSSDSPKEGSHRFEVTKKLGSGTYGKVMLAYDRKMHKEVAIKIIKKNAIENKQDLVRIRREIRIMAALKHPHVIQIFEVFENRDKIIIVLEYACNGELYDYVSSKGCLPEADARRIFREIVSSVLYCHRHKIAHRDLKLENILLDKDMHAKIADFGLSNYFGEKALLQTFCGSPLYASPEIINGIPYKGPEVDCWSLGVLLYTLVYGSMPFDGRDFNRMVRQIKRGAYYEPDQPSTSSSLIRNMLRVNAERRGDIYDISTHWWLNVDQSATSILDLPENQVNNHTPLQDRPESLIVQDLDDGCEIFIELGQFASSTRRRLDEFRRRRKDAERMIEESLPEKKKNRRQSTTKANEVAQHEAQVDSINNLRQHMDQQVRDVSEDQDLVSTPRQPTVRSPSPVTTRITEPRRTPVRHVPEFIPEARKTPVRQTPEFVPESRRTPVRQVPESTYEPTEEWQDPLDRLKALETRLYAPSPTQYHRPHSRIRSITPDVPTTGSSSISMSEGESSTATRPVSPEAHRSRSASPQPFSRTAESKPLQLVQPSERAAPSHTTRPVSYHGATRPESRHGLDVDSLNMLMNQLLEDSEKKIISPSLVIRIKAHPKFSSSQFAQELLESIVSEQDSTRKISAPADVELSKYTNKAAYRTLSPASQYAEITAKKQPELTKIEKHREMYHKTESTERPPSVPIPSEMPAHVTDTLSTLKECSAVSQSSDATVTELGITAARISNERRTTGSSSTNTTQVTQPVVKTSEAEVPRKKVSVDEMSKSRTTSRQNSEQTGGMSQRSAISPTQHLTQDPDIEDPDDDITPPEQHLYSTKQETVRMWRAVSIEVERSDDGEELMDEEDTGDDIDMEEVEADFNSDLEDFQLPDGDELDDDLLHDSPDQKKKDLEEQDDEDSRSFVSASSKTTSRPESFVPPDPPASAPPFCDRDATQRQSRTRYEKLIALLQQSRDSDGEEYPETRKRIGGSQPTTAEADALFERARLYLEKYPDTLSPDATLSNIPIMTRSESPPRIKTIDLDPPHSSQSKHSSNMSSTTYESAPTPPMIKLMSETSTLDEQTTEEKPSHYQIRQNMAASLTLNALPSTGLTPSECSSEDVSTSDKTSNTNEEDSSWAARRRSSVLSPIGAVPREEDEFVLHQAPNEQSSPTKSLKEMGESTATMVAQSGIDETKKTSFTGQRSPLARTFSPPRMFTFDSQSPPSPSDVTRERVEHSTSPETNNHGSAARKSRDSKRKRNKKGAQSTSPSESLFQKATELLHRGFSRPKSKSRSESPGEQQQQKQKAAIPKEPAIQETHEESSSKLSVQDSSDDVGYERRPSYRTAIHSSALPPTTQNVGVTARSSGTSDATSIGEYPKTVPSDGTSSDAFYKYTAQRYGQENPSLFSYVRPRFNDNTYSTDYSGSSSSYRPQRRVSLEDRRYSPPALDMTTARDRSVSPAALSAPPIPPRTYLYSSSDRYRSQSRPRSRTEDFERKLRENSPQTTGDNSRPTSLQEGNNYRSRYDHNFTYRRSYYDVLEEEAPPNYAPPPPPVAQSSQARTNVGGAKKAIMQSWERSNSLENRTQIPSQLDYNSEMRFLRLLSPEPRVSTVSSEYIRASKARSPSPPSTTTHSTMVNDSSSQANGFSSRFRPSRFMEKLRRHLSSEKLHRVDEESAVNGHVTAASIGQSSYRPSASNSTYSAPAAYEPKPRKKRSILDMARRRTTEVTRSELIVPTTSISQAQRPSSPLEKIKGFFRKSKENLTDPSTSSRLSSQITSNVTPYNYGAAAHVSSLSSGYSSGYSPRTTTGTTTTSNYSPRKAYYSRPHSTPYTSTTGGKYWYEDHSLY